MNIGIIGSQGYIGSFLSEKLQNDQFNVFNFSKVFRNINQNNFMASRGRDIPADTIQRMDIIVYVAGISGIDTCSKYTMQEIFNENVNDIFEVASKMKPHQLLIYASTAIIGEGYGDTLMRESDPVKEDHLTIYSKSFHVREQKLATLQNGPKCIGLRLGTVVGVSPLQNITRIYIAMLRSAFLKGYITVNSPDAMRGILWGYDLYRTILTIIQSHNKIDILHRIYNISSFNCSVARIANEIARHTGAPTKFHNTGNSVGFSLDTTLFCQDYGFDFRGNHSNIIQDLLDHIEHICADDKKTSVHHGICRVCKSIQVMPVLDLGCQPLANCFVLEPTTLPGHPLALERCRECNHTQLTHTVPPQDMFSHYLYKSGTNRTIIEYFEWLAAKCIDESESNNGIVLELASNDGSQLDIFKKLGWTTYGVDPAENISSVASEKGHQVTVGFWGCITTDHLPTPDIIIAQNVFAHVPDPVLFLQACADIMNDTTKLYVQTSQCDMYTTGEFDTIYHEHLSFFTGHSFRKVAEMVGLVIVNFEITPIHGNSFLVTMQKKQNADHCEALLTRVAYETQIGMNTDLFWIRYRNKAQITKSWLLQHMYPLRDNGYMLAAYGAAAKGMTLLNYIDTPGIEFIVDDALLKQNTYSPGQKIPIYPSNRLSEMKQPMAILLLAWNFFNEIVENIRKLRSGYETVIITPFPNQAMYYITDDGIKKIISNDIVQLPYPIPQQRPKTLMVSHFYNEELLLPYFIRHHAPLFDDVTLIDYDSTDASLAIIAREAPTGWKVVTSRNRDFDAIDVDSEVMYYEKQYPSDWWKIALTATEFLVHPNFRETLSQYSKPCNFRFPSFIINGNDDVPLEKNVSLIQQRCQYMLSNTFGITEYSRFIGYKNDMSYSMGRHFLTNYDTSQKLSEAYHIHGYLCAIPFLYTGFIFKYQNSPWPESKGRKIQISNRISQRSKNYGQGFQHFSENIILTHVMTHRGQPFVSADTLSRGVTQQPNYSHLDVVNTWCNATLEHIKWKPIKKHYRAIILIIASCDLPAYKNARNVLKQYMNSDPDIAVYFVYGKLIEPLSDIDEHDLIYEDVPENHFPGILQKTIRAMEYLDAKYSYDYFIRTNISTFWNFSQLKEHLNDLPTTRCYAGDGPLPWYNEHGYYLSGSDTIVSGDLIPQIIANKDKLDYNMMDDMAMGRFFHGTLGVPMIRSRIHFMEQFTSVEQHGLILTEIQNGILQNKDHYRVKSKHGDREVIDNFIYQMLLKEIYHID